MTSSAKPLDAVAIVTVVVLCLSWGFNQVAVKLALPDIPPLMQAAIRSAGAAVIVLAWARLRHVPLGLRDGTLTPGFWCGVLFAFEFLLIYRGLLYTTATRAVVFLYTTPFFVALGASWFIPGERLGRMQWLGLLLSFAGLTLAFGAPAPADNPSALLGDVMVVGAAALWAATTLLVKASALQRAPAEKTLAYQLVVSAPILGAGALLFGEGMSVMPGAVALVSLAYQTIWVAGITFLAWFMLIKHFSASRVAAFTFLTPLFGVAAGHLVLGEPLTPVFALAAALVAAGLVLVNRPR